MPGLLRRLRNLEAEARQARQERRAIMRRLDGLMEAAGLAGAEIPEALAIAARCPARDAAAVTLTAPGGQAVIAVIGPEGGSAGEMWKDILGHVSPPDAAP